MTSSYNNRVRLCISGALFARVSPHKNVRNICSFRSLVECLEIFLPADWSTGAHSKRSCVDQLLTCRRNALISCTDICTWWLGSDLSSSSDSPDSSDVLIRHWTQILFWYLLVHIRISTDQLRLEERFLIEFSSDHLAFPVSWYTVCPLKLIF